MAQTSQPMLRPTDVLSVKSRVSWAAIAAGAMVSLAVYFLLTLLGLAVGLELGVGRNNQIDLRIGAALWSIATLLFSMFIGGWATSTLAVGETRLEAFLYGVILWGVLFIGMFWMVGQGIRVGFSALVGVATNAAAFTDADPASAASVKAKLEEFGNDPTPIAERTAAVASDPESRKVAAQAVWYTLAGVVISMAAVIFGSIIGSGDAPVLVPLAGVRARPSAPPKV